MALGIPPFATFTPDHSTDLALADAAYGSRGNLAVCKRAGVAPGILHKINVTAHAKESSDM